MEFLKFNDFVNENSLDEGYLGNVVNAETMKDVKKIYPRAKKTSEVHGAVFYIELDKNLFAKAVSQNTMKSVEPFVIEAVYQMKGKKQKFLYTESVNESNKYSVHYSDGMRSAQEFKREDQAMQFAKDLIKTKKGLQFVSVHKPGMYQTAHKEDLLAWWGPGSYWDNVSKKDKDVVKMQISESFRNKKPMGFSKDETLEVAKKVAEAISKLDGVKCTVNMKTLEEDSFDLDYDGDEYDGGSYNLYSDGSVVNMAVRRTPTIAHVDDSVKDIMKTLKKDYGKLAKESVNEAADYSELALSDIASIVYDDWKKISPHAAPYLDAMLDLENITDRYFMDSGISIVAYFLSNARTWKGSVAKDVKKELNKRLKNAR